MRATRFILIGILLIGSAAVADEKPRVIQPKAPAKMTDAQLTKLAMSAGPADITKDATIAVMNDDMKGMREIKKGTNGWLCLAMGTDSMCADKAWQEWAGAWLGHTKPTVTGVGIAYMLAGDHGASNSDPYAMEAKPDNNWIVSPPHIMVLSPDTKLLDSLPTDPHTGGPWVMWKGTDYAHIMVPTVAMPKEKAAKPAK
jgi:hypothetical protein